MKGENRDIGYWQSFVERYYSTNITAGGQQGGVLRHGVITPNSGTKLFEVNLTILPRYYFTLFNNGIKRIQTHMEGVRDRDMGPLGHLVECQKASFMYWFSNDCQVGALSVSSGVRPGLIDGIALHDRWCQDGP